MQCFMKKEDRSLIDVDNVETIYFDNGAFFAALASFLLQFFSPPSQSCYSRILCNLLHLPLWFYSLFYPVGVIQLNIATTSSRRLTCML